MHRRALVLLPCLIPCHRCEKSARNLATLTIFDHATWQHTRESSRHVRGSARIYDVRMAQFVLKIENGSARIPRLTVSVSDYGSCVYWTLVYVNHIGASRWYTGTKTGWTNKTEFAVKDMGFHCGIRKLSFFLTPWEVYLKLFKVQTNTKIHFCNMSDLVE